MEVTVEEVTAEEVMAVVMALEEDTEAAMALVEEGEVADQADLEQDDLVMVMEVDLAALEGHQEAALVMAGTDHMDTDTVA